MNNTYLLTKNIRNRAERGAVLFIALVILGAVLAIVFGIGALLAGQIKLVGGIGNAVAAFYAAEAGIEREAAVSPPHSPGWSDTDVPLSNGATYTVFILDPSDSACNGAARCIKSVGAFHGTSRAINIALD